MQLHASLVFELLRQLNAVVAALVFSDADFEVLDVILAALRLAAAPFSFPEATESFALPTFQHSPHCLLTFVKVYGDSFHEPSFVAQSNHPRTLFDAATDAIGALQFPQGSLFFCIQAHLDSGFGHRRFYSSSTSIS
jgi:hypothetical protein